MYMLTPNSFNIPLHVLFTAIFCFVTQSLHLGAAVMLGTTLYQLYYEWTHLVSHRPIVPATSIGKNRKKLHLLHHYKSDQNWFGVTNVTFDNVAGTNPPSAHVPNGKINMSREPCGPRSARFFDSFVPGGASSRHREGVRR
jgi:4-hydroxysphinganine ceramide fatty acyl 2-hydroxylase